jgi:hypothetical protein
VNNSSKWPRCPLMFFSCPEMQDSVPVCLEMAASLSWRMEWAIENDHGFDNCDYRMLEIVTSLGIKFAWNMHTD